MAPTTVRRGGTVTNIEARAIVTMPSSDGVSMIATARGLVVVDPPCTAALARGGWHSRAAAGLCFNFSSPR